jgi:FdhE protein
MQAGGLADQLLTLAMRPFLGRCADVLQPCEHLHIWMHGHCPLCAGEPDFSVITTSADRLLICSRCVLRWRFDPLSCPYCGNDDRGRITSFATPDGWYRVYGCDACRRYLKSFDARRSSRPVLPVVDGVATLPLDAAAMQRGYST